MLVIGAGSIGLLFGGYLAQHGMNVIFGVRRIEQARLLKEEGLFLHTLDGEIIRGKVETLYVHKPNPDMFHPFRPDMIIVTVKHPDLKEVLDWISAHVSARTPILFLMNGLGHDELVRERLSHSHLYFGVTQNGAIRLNMNEVNEKGKGVTHIGRVHALSPLGNESHSESEPVIQHLMDRLSHRGMALSWSSQIEIEMWRKCIINACINPLTALFQVKNGLLIQNPHLKQMMEQLYMEIVQLCQSAPFLLDQEQIFRNGQLWNEIVNVCYNTRANTSSMLQDILHKRQTEIESITGYMLRKAREYCVNMPYHQFLYQSIHYLQTYA